MRVFLGDLSCISEGVVFSTVNSVGWASSCLVAVVFFVFMIALSARTMVETPVLFSLNSITIFL